MLAKDKLVDRGMVDIGGMVNSFKGVVLVETI